MNGARIKTNTVNKTISGADCFVKTLSQNGVDTIFGYPGAPILPLYNALSEQKAIKHYLSRHEQGAIHSAEGYAKVSGKCGVVLVTSGPGFTNTLTGIVNAHTDKTPIVVISAQVEKCDMSEFQYTDISGMTKSTVKKVYQITKAEDIEKSVTLAIHRANKTPKGVVVVTVTKSVLEEKIEEEKRFKLKKEIKVEAPHSCVLKSLDYLKSAQKPLIIIGGGCKDAEKEVVEFAHLTHIPIVNTLMAKGVSDDISLGMIGSNGNQTLNQLIEQSDVVLALGVRFTNRTTDNKAKFLPNSKIINVNIEPSKSTNIDIHNEILGEMGIVLQQMIGVIKSKNILFSINFDWIETLSSSCSSSSIENDKTTGLSSEYVLNEIYKYTKKYRPIITTDVGQHQMNVNKIFKVCSSRNFITSGGFGTMGFGLPSAIGAYIAKPNALVMNITGDGSFQMNIQELGVCAEYNVPIKIFIMNNSSLGMIGSLQEKLYGKKYQSNMINPDFIKISNAYGILGYKITSKSELQVALTQMFKYKKAVILDIMISE